MLIVACGSDSDPASDGGADPSPPPAQDTAAVEAGTLDDFNADVEAAVASLTGDSPNVPPGGGPAPETGKKIYVIPCTMVAEGCARPARAAIEAAESLGWEATLIDPGGDPTKTAEAIDKAVSAGADGLVLAGGADAELYVGPLQAAKDAGVAVSCFACVDNADDLIPDQIPSEASYVDAGYSIAQAMYEATGGHLRMIMLIDDGAGVVRLQVEGTEKFIDECKAAGGDCEIVAQQKYVLQDLTTTVPALAVSVVRQNPDYNVLWVGYDAALTFIQPALEEAGLTGSEAFGVGFNGDLQALDRIRNGQFQRLTLGNALEWVGYGQIDNLNRLFAGEPTADPNLQFKVLTEDNVPAEGNWEGDQDFRAVYREAWGLQP